MRANILMASLLLMSTQAIASDPETADVTTNMPENANFIIYREYAEPTVWSPTIKIDGKKLAALGNRRYTATHLEPGTYSIKLVWPLLSGQRGKEIEVTIKEGETRYFEIVGISQVSGVGYQVIYFTVGSGIAEIEPAFAKAAIEQCCKFIAKN